MASPSELSYPPFRIEDRTAPLADQATVVLAHLGTAAA